MNVTELRAKYLTQKLDLETIRATAVVPIETIDQLKKLTGISSKNELIGVALVHLLNTLEAN